MSNPPIPRRKNKRLKRANGTGSVYKIKDQAIWAVQIFPINPVTGKKKKKVIKFRSHKEATAYLEDYNHSIRNGTYSFHTNEKATIKEFLDTHISRYVDGKRAPETLRNYKSARSRICDEVGGMNASKFQPRDVEVLLEKLEEKYKQNTVCNAYAVLTAAYNKAVKIGEMPSNPCLRIDAPKRELNPTKHIPLPDFAAIYQEASLNPYSHARIEIGMFVPIRPSEILGLQWKDINWEESTIHVERQLQRVKNEGLVFRETKTKKSRTIPISNETLEILRTHKQYQEMNKASWVDEDSDLIFPNTIGKPLDAKRDLKWWKDILNRAGVKHYQLYQMRKTAISHLENLGTPDSTILKFTGHTNMSTVRKHYASSTDEADRAALAGLDLVRSKVKEMAKANEY